MQKYEVLIEGFIGALVYALLAKKLLRHKLVYIFCGTICTYYFAPVIIHLYSIQSDEYKALVAFISGVAGADLLRVVVQAVLQYLPATIKKKLGVD